MFSQNTFSQLLFSQNQGTATVTGPIWIVQCPTESDWDERAKDQVGVRECTKVGAKDAS